MFEKFRNHDADGNHDAVEKLRATRAAHDTRSAVFDAEQQKRHRDFEETRRKKVEFLATSVAQPVPKELYAVWLLAWLNTGGSVTQPRDRNFPTASINPGAQATQRALSRITDKGPEFEERIIQYYDQSCQWMPTKEFGPIPTGYGAASMNLLILPQSVNGSLKPTSGDSRRGWEYGHTNVKTLILDTGTGRLIAETNEPDQVESFLDVEALIENGEATQMTRQFIEMANHNTITSDDIYRELGQ